MLLLLAVLCSCKGESTVYTLNYVAGEGGHIKGNATQFVEEGKDGTSVTAIPSEGYEFVKWSDDVTTATRQDKSVKADLTVTAQFQKTELIKYTVQYLSSEGGSIQGQTEQTVLQGKNATAVTAIPNEGYEFVKWSDDVATATRQDKAISRNITVTAIFQKESPQYYTIRYIIEEGGILTDGELEYKLMSGQTPGIVAVATKDGYEFLGWSDGNDMTWRSDIMSNYDKTITARFRRIDEYKLLDWYAVYEQGVPTMEINKDTYTNLHFPIPEREHFTFEGWYLGETMVADAQGNSFFTEDDLDYGGRSITAKWTANETFTYKILLVYVTRIVATLPNVNPNITEKIELDYTMSEKEREFCHLITLRTKQRLDEMMDGLVDFQVDEYYTTKTITTKDFNTAVGKTHPSSLRIQHLEEVADILLQYDSSLILYDATQATTNSSGQAGMKYGEVRLDGFWDSIAWYHSTLDEVIDLLKKGEDLYLGGKTYLIDEYLVGTIRHELAHTIELRVNLEDYHNCVIGDGTIYRQVLTSFEVNRLYFLNVIEKDGKKAGIPYKFWKGDIAKLMYIVSENKNGGQGYVTSKCGIAVPSGSGNTLVEAVYGQYVTAVAVPSLGQRFIKWSDGVTTAERTDLITGDFTVTAIFEPITYTLTVVASEGGKIIEGEGTWEIQRYGAYIHIQAEAAEGYRFVGWSDGVTDIKRSFRIQVNEIKLFDENNRYTLTAIFEKIE